MIDSEKKYVVVADGKTYRFNEQDWTANMDEFMKDFPQAEIAEVESYKSDDYEDNDSIVVRAGDRDFTFSGKDWKTNESEFMKDFPDAQIARVRGVDYHYNQANKLESDINAKDEEIKAWQDSRADRTGMDWSSVMMQQAGLSPIGAGFDPERDAALATYAAEGTRLQQERDELQKQFDSNPRVIEARERAKQMEQEYRDGLWSQAETIVNNVGEDVLALKSVDRALDDTEAMVMEQRANRLANDTTYQRKEEYDKAGAAMSMLEHAKDVREGKADGFWEGAGHYIEKEIEGVMYQGESRTFTQVGLILKKLNDEIGSLNDLTAEDIDKHLSKEDALLLRSYFELMSAQNEANFNWRNNWKFKAGEIAAAAIPFALEFAATSGAADDIAKGATKGLTLALEKWIADGIEKGGKAVGRKAVSKAADLATRGALKAAIMTAARPSTYGTIAQHLPEIDEKGDVNLVRNAAIGALDSYIETVSEMSGGMISDILGVPLKWGKGLTSKVFGNAFKNVKFPQWAKVFMNGAFKDYAKAVGFHGLPEEILEEYVGNALRLSYDKNAISEMHKDGNFRAMLLGFVPMTIMGGTASVARFGVVDQRAGQLGDKLKRLLTEKGFAESRANALTERRSDKSPLELALQMNELREELEKKGATEEELKMVDDYALAVAEFQTLRGITEMKDKQDLDEVRAELTNQYGTYAHNGNVTTAKTTDGRSVFIVSDKSATGEYAAVDMQTGQHITISDADIVMQNNAQGQPVQALSSKPENQYIGDRLLERNRLKEAERMLQERNEQIAKIKELMPEQLNLGTEGEPNMVVVKSQDANGVTVVDANGNEAPMSWDAVGRVMGMPIHTFTDMELATMEAQEIALKREALRAARAKTYAENNNVSEELEQIKEKLNDITPKPEAEYTDEQTGEVDEVSFWENDPEGYCDWNDRQNNDGGVDSIEQLENSIASLTSQYDAATKASKTDNPMSRKTANREAKRLAERIKRLQAIQNGYLEKLTEQIMSAVESAEQRAETVIAMRERINEWREKFNLDESKLTVYESLDEVENAGARKQIMQAETPGWTTGSRERGMHAYVYLPHVKDMASLDKVIMHEVVTHYGLKTLLGEKDYNALMDKVWNMMSDSARRTMSFYPGVQYKEGDERRRTAAEEFVALVAEDIVMDKASAETSSLWKRVADAIADKFDKMQVRFSGTDVAGIVKDNYTRLEAEGISEATAEEGATEDTTANAEEVLVENGYDVDEQNGDVRFSSRYITNDAQREDIISSIVEVTGRSAEDAERWLLSEVSVASLVLADKEYLDYDPDEKYKAIKDNSDYPQGTVDFNNICRKRIPFTKMYTRLQRRYPNRIFTAEELADIRTIMSEDGLTVACGLCYVEDRRQQLGEVADGFIADLKDGFRTYAQANATKKGNAVKFLILVGSDSYVPTIYDLITLEGSDKLYREHRGIWEAFGAYNRARGQQTQNTFQGYAEYKREILGWSKAKVNKVNSLGGLRVFSYSDFEAHHLLDLVQIIIDCAAKGVMIQGYTKVPEFARAVANTNIKLNRSLIPLGDTGIVDGQLAFDPVEGIDINDPNFLESNDNVGNILIGINSEQIRLAMADPRIHYIIPYHARQARSIRNKLNVGAWSNYTDTQNERDAKTGKKVADNINIYTDILGPDVTNDREFVEKYLQKCAEMGRIPKFDEFLDKDAEGNYVYTPGYYKFLVDFKLFDENGNILPQKPVVAQFDDAFNMQILQDYAKGERETAGEQMNATYDKIVETLGLNEEEAEGEDIMFKTEYDRTPPPRDAVAKIIDYLFANKDKNKGIVERRVISAVTPRQIEEYRKKGIDNVTERFVHSIDNSSIRHKVKRHGGDNRTQEPLSKEEWHNILDVIENFDRVDKQKSRSGLDVIVYQKKYDDGTIFYVEEIRTGRESLALTTAYKKRGDSSGLMEHALPPTSETTLDNTSFESKDTNKSDTTNDSGENTFFKTSNRNQAIFVSNAAKAVEGIKMEKATPEQWLKMLEKNGGLKAGEDKWMGLSDWLKASDKKTLTKDEVLDFINEHMIIIEEQEYAFLDQEVVEQEAYKNLIEKYGEDFVKRFVGPAFIYEEGFRGPYIAINDPIEAKDLYYEETGKEIRLTENGDLTYPDQAALVKWAETVMREAEHIDGVRSTERRRRHYVTKNLDNYHEIALTVPAIHPWNTDDVTHFGDAGNGRAVVWIRFGETTTKNGEKVLVIDEVQSKRHDTGRKKGYADVRVEKQIDAAFKEYEQKNAELNEYYKFLDEKYGVPTTLKSPYATKEEIKKLKQLRKEAKEAHSRWIDARSQKGAYGIPDAPFEKNWHELAMKRMLRYAAENGFDYIAWTLGEQQRERYNLTKLITGVGVNVPTNSTGRAVSLHYKGEEGPDYFYMEIDEAGKVKGGHAKGRKLSEVVGKAIADQIMEVEDSAKIEAKDLRVGGEGLADLYDKMLPTIMTKYGKQWGVKVSDIELPNAGESGLTMHSVPVTEEMKASVMEGQTMFKTRMPNQSVTDFLNEVVPEFESKYNVVVPASIMKLPTRAALAKAIKLDISEIDDEFYDEFMKKWQQSYAIYIPVTDENGKVEHNIIIFADSEYKTSYIVDTSLFHENIHGLVTENDELLKLGAWLYENDKQDAGISAVKPDVEQYDEDDRHEEMLTHYVSYVMALGFSQRALDIVPDELKPLLNYIYERFGYNPETEDGERRRRYVSERDEINGRTWTDRPSIKVTKGERKGGDGEALFKTAVTPEVRREMDVISAQAIVNGNYMKAPNGKDSKLTPEQWALVRTQNFKDWFGDWENDPENSSKVVDENGEPMVVYHGTAGVINKFEDQQRSPGFWFTNREDVANGYAESASAEFGEEKNVIPVFLNIRKPRVEDAHAEYPAEFALKSYVENDNGVYEVFDTYEEAEAYREANVPDGWVGAAEVGDQHDLVERAKELGHDGVVMMNMYDQAAYAETEVKGTQTNYVVLDANQIKSATDNTGEFSEDADIRFKTVYGGNRGYVGYSMSKRAAEARSEGRYPKTDFRKEYNVTAPALDLLVSSGIIDGNEWHHTSMYGNRTKFYGWYEDEYADIYTANKKEIDALAREYKKEDEEFRGSGKANREKLIAGEITPQEEYELNREASDKHYAFQREVEDKIDAIFNPVEPDGSGDETTMFKTRTAPAPTKTQDVYKLMRLGADGKLYPLFIGSAEPIELGTWYDAESPNLGDLTKLASGVHLVNNETSEAMTLDEFKAQYPEITIKGKRPNVDAINWATENGARWIEIEDKATAQRRYEGESRSYYNLGINGSGQVGQFAMRPGWHAGSLPTMRQIGKGKDKNLRDDSFVWVKGRIPADVDYQSEADANPDKDIPTHIPTDGFYMKATNANAKASQADKMGWYVAGSFIADEIMSDAEARSVIDSWNAEHPDAKVEHDYPRESGREFDPARGGLVESDTMFKTDPSTMNVDELVEQGKQKVIAENKDAIDVFMDRIRAINGNLQQLRMAAAAQRQYDKRTVDAIVKQANELLEAGKLADLTRGEIKRILSVVNNATGKVDLTNEVGRLMDIMIANQLRMGRENIDKFLRIRGKKVDQRGVEVRGRLDIKGQLIMDTIRENIGNDLLDILMRIVDVQEKLTSESEVVRRNAENELIGLEFARQYVENIKDSEKEEKRIRQEIKDAEQEYKDGVRDRKTFVDFANAANEAIRENRIQRVLAYQKLAEDLAKLVTGSITNAGLLRDAEKDRVQKIQHFANSDLKGLPYNEHGKVDSMWWNNPFVRFLLKPLATFDQMLRHFGSKSVNGEGYLWNHFMRGWLRATETEYKGVQAAHEILDAKAREVFRREGIKKWSDIFEIDRKLPTATVTWWDGGEMRDHEVTQGNLLYIYMVNKMTDGKMKLRKMGITEDDVDDIKNALDPRFIALADWIQDEFLPSLRDKYNALHEKLFGASMAAIDSYFPIRVLANAREREVDLGVEESTAKPSTITGSIIKRTRNSLALDILGSNAFDVVLDHIQQMEHWSAFAEFNQDLNTLLSYRRFRNRVQNMSGIYGSGNVVWSNFRSVAELAAGVYQPASKSDSIDKTAINLAKGVTSAKISFRVYTAIKQLLSMPAFVSDARADDLLEFILTPWEAWNWAMENLPLFEKRWKSRQAGDSRLMQTDSDWKLWKTKVVELASRYGMSPNAFVDAVTVAIGARSIYESKKRIYMKMGYQYEEASERAKQDATILFNESQQSNESAFLSTMQVDRTAASVAFSLFRNSSMGYQRMFVDALRNIKRKFTKGYKEESIEFMKKQLIRDGLEETAAEKAAKRMYTRSIMHSAMRAVTFGFVVQFAWNLGAYLPYLIAGDDDDEKRDMVKDAARHALFGPIEGLSGGSVLSEMGNLVASGEGLKDYDPTLLPVVSDMKRLLNMFSYDEVAAANEMFNLLIQAGIGVNPQTLTDTAVAIIDACNGDLKTATEATLCLLRILQIPQTQADKIYIDEIDFTADKGLELTIYEFAKRYADYKVKRGAPLTGWMYSSEKEQERIDKYIKRFDKMAEEYKRSRGNEEAKKYYEYLDTEYKEVTETIADLKRKAQAESMKGNMVGAMEYAEMLDEFMKTDVFQRYTQYGGMAKAVEKLRDQLLKVDNPTMEMLEDTMLKIRKEMVEEMKKAND